MIECCSATAAIFIFGGIYLLFPLISTVQSFYNTDILLNY